MKILLIGEFSHLHNSLKEGLETLGHEVTLVGDGDNFKNFPVDISLRPTFLNSSWFIKKLRIAYYKITTIDLLKLESKIRYLQHKDKFKNFDVVQFIHSNALKTNLKFQLKEVEYLQKNNKRLFLVACGNDYPIVTHNLSKKPKYSPLTPYLQGEDTEKNAAHMLYYISNKYKKFYNAFEKKMSKIIPVDMDYVLPLMNVPKVTPIIPTPINTNKLIPVEVNYKEEIHIFMGVNEGTKIRKGIPFFEKALEDLKKKYGEKITVTIAKNLPYKEYIKSYDQAHILLDMVYAYDQGYNALEAMAKQKVVFTGAEKEFLAHYNLQEDEVCINALPDVNFLVEKLSWLIDNPNKIEEIGKNARAFVKREHDYIKIAKKYVEVWEN